MLCAHVGLTRLSEHRLLQFLGIFDAPSFVLLSSLLNTILYYASN